ncbi:SRPBCC domain-containing protein [Herbiconiux sp. L3-i23]|uniref:SRPBCC family protein n=1 Tax=Herbiconiux sp. L3-i23 TaxID=2905871 RepID=UPI00204934FE|nr:SRPBCC domain-containing protein [Herbiconiux sp. L3-i23]BDI22675.1 activator of HSP90 ATPase [Herbiconiux sp. L3-i23]
MTFDGLEIMRTFATSPDRVFAAWTEPAQFAAWFGTAAVDVPLDTVSMDVRVGGRWSAIMRFPDGNSIDWVGEYRKVDPPTRLALTLTDAPSEDAGEPVTVDLVEVPSGTEMTFRQPRQGFTDEQLDLTVVGYNAFFDDLEKLLLRAP